VRGDFSFDLGANELLDTLQLEQVEILMETLFECIILTIDIPQRDEDFVDMSKFR
jgi:hypothetical protein